MIEYANNKVTQDVGGEEAPVLIRHCFGSEIDVIHCVNPHEASVVEKVDGDGSVKVARQFSPVFDTQSAGYCGLAFYTNLIQVTDAFVVSLRLQQVLVFFLLLFFQFVVSKGLEEIRAERRGVFGALWSAGSRGHRL